MDSPSPSSTSELSTSAEMEDILSAFNVADIENIETLKETIYELKQKLLLTSQQLIEKDNQITELKNQIQQLTSSSPVKKKVIIRKTIKKSIAPSIPSVSSSEELSTINQSTNQEDQTTETRSRTNSLNDKITSEESPNSPTISLDRIRHQRTSSSDVSLLTDEDIKVIANRRKRNQVIQLQHLDSPRDISSPTDQMTTSGMLSDFDVIVTNILYASQDFSFYFRGIYPNVDPLYETYDYEAAAQLHYLDDNIMESEMGSLNLLKTMAEASDITKKSRNITTFSKPRKNTPPSISRVDSGNDLLSSAPKLLPYEHYHQCLESKSLACLFTQEYQQQYLGFNEDEAPSNFIRDTSTGAVKAGTLDKLIVQLTSNEEFDNEYMHLFLLTYRSFTTPMELLDKLILRFNIPPPLICYQAENDGNTEELEKEFRSFYSKTLQPIRLRIGQVLNNWVQNHYYDFREDVELKFKLEQFIDKDMSESGMKTLSKTLKNLHERLSKRKETFKVQQLEEVKRRHELEGNINQSSPRKGLQHFKLLNRNSEESLKTMPLWQLGNKRLCEQLTLISFRLFEKLRPKEFLNQNWMKETRMKKAPNIYDMITRSNEVGMWVASEILNYEDVKERAYVLKQFIKVATECEKIHNYNTMYDIVSGLNSNAIHRLKKTWELVPEKWRVKFQDLLTLTSPKKSYHALREALHSNADQCVLPYIGMFLTDCLFIEEGNSDFTKEGNLINFSKRRLLGQFIRQIQTYQQNSYNIDIIPLLHQRLTRLIYRPMDELYEISCRYEIPPQVTAKKKKKNYVYDDSTLSEQNTVTQPAEPTTESSITEQTNEPPEDLEVEQQSSHITDI